MVRYYTKVQHSFKFFITLWSKIEMTMKKILLLTVCLLFGIAEMKAAEPVEKSDTLYILGVGNSWTRDSMRWLSAIAESAGRPVVVGHAYLGGSTLEQQYRGIDDDTFTYPHRRVNQGQSGVELADAVLHQRIMGASKYKCVNAISN